MQPNAKKGSSIADVYTVECTVSTYDFHQYLKGCDNEAGCDIWNIYGSNAFQFVLTVQKR